MEDLTGKQLGPYKLIEQLGKGGMGAVYKTFQPKLNRYIAIKVLPLHLANDPVFLSRFEQEAGAAAKLSHPHIVPIHEYGESEGYHYITMQLIESRKTLRNLLRGQPLKLLDFRRVVLQIGGALDYAHQHRVVHRDVKPANILFSEAGFYYLTDFGIAKDLDRTEQFTQAGTGIGTVRYMSPEQFQGGEIDGRSDLYSLGVVMFEMATGRVPFVSTNPFVLQKDHQTVTPPPPRSLNPNLLPELEEIILKLLAKNREDRYPTGQALLDDLRKAVLDDGSRPNRRVELDKRIAEYPPTESVPVPDAEPAPPPPLAQPAPQRPGSSGPVLDPDESVPPPPLAQPAPQRSGSKRPLMFLGLAALVLLLCGAITVAGLGLGSQLFNNSPTPTDLALVVAGTTPTDALPVPDTDEAATSDSNDTVTTAVSPTALPEQSTSENEPEPASPTPVPVVESTATDVPVSPATEAVEATATPLPTPTPAPTPTPVPAVAAADMSGHLAIPLMYGNEPKVYVVDSSNGDLQNIIGSARQPDYTLDGSKLVVDGHGGGDNKLRISDPLGNGTYQIGDLGLTEHSHPSWSPDSSQVIYDDATIDPSGTRIYFGGLDTRQGPGTELNAAAGPIIGQYPLWTSRGFVFRGCNTWGNVPSQCGLWLMPGNTGEPAQLTDNLRHIPVDTRGDTLAYVSDEAGNWDVYVLNLSTGQSRQLTTSRQADGLPAISPDGRTVAFLSNRENLSVWAVNINGGDPQKLFDLPPDWGQLRADGWSEEKLSWGAN